MLELSKNREVNTMSQSTLDIRPHAAGQGQAGELDARLAAAGVRLPTGEEITMGDLLPPTPQHSNVVAALLRFFRRRR